MTNRRIIITACLVLGAILFNGWLLGFLGHGRVGYSEFSISELEVSSQAWHWLFRSLDGLAGLLFIIGGCGVFMLRHLARSFWLNLVAILIVALGLLTLFDIMHPLDCVRYHNPVCVTAIADHRLSHTNNLHESESRITAYVSGFIALAIIVWAWCSDLAKVFVGIAVVLLGFIILALTIENTTHSVLADAAAQRSWNLFVSSDIILLVIGINKLVKKQNLSQSKPKSQS